MPLTCGLPDRSCRLAALTAPRREGEKGATPAGGESGRRAHGPALGGEAGSVLLEAYPQWAHE